MEMTQKECWNELHSAIKEAKHRWQHSCPYCETQLLSAIAKWSEVEHFLRKNYPPQEDYYKAILFELLGPKIYTEGVS